MFSNDHNWSWGLYSKTLLHITMIIYWTWTNQSVKDMFHMTFENVLPNAIITGKTDLFAHSIYRCSSCVHAHLSVAIYQYGMLEWLWNDSHAISALINLNDQLICYSSGLISRASIMQGVIQCISAVNGQNTLSNFSLQFLTRQKEEHSVLSVLWKWLVSLFLHWISLASWIGSTANNFMWWWWGGSKWDYIF